MGVRLLEMGQRGPALHEHMRRSDELMRLFELHRDHDVSGVSGTGIVAEGVEFSDGTCVVRWRSGVGSTGVWHSIKDVEAIHGHGGATRVVWLEPHPARAR